MERSKENIVIISQAVSGVAIFSLGVELIRMGAWEIGAVISTIGFAACVPPAHAVGEKIVQFIDTKDQSL